MTHLYYKFHCPFCQLHNFYGFVFRTAQGFFLNPFTIITIAIGNSLFGFLSLHVLMDPWGCENKSTSAETEFEDNFKPEKSDKLADSAEYLAILERKLKKLKNKNKVVENLAAYRADCIDRLMREGCDLDPVIGDTESEKLLEDQVQDQE